MKNKLERDLGFIETMLENAYKIQEKKERLYRLNVGLQDEMFVDLMSFYLAQIGEQAAKSKILREMQERFPGFPWSDVNAFRNYINHDYSNVKPKILVDTVFNDIPELIRQIRRNENLFGEGIRAVFLNRKIFHLPILRFI